MKARQLRSRAKVVKPRNPVLAALKQGLGAKAGPHRKSGGAQRRAHKITLAKQALDE